LTEVQKAVQSKFIAKQVYGGMQNGPRDTVGAVLRKGC
jgi:hypothetical protein